MIEIEISEDQISLAKNKSEEMGKLRNSIRGGKGNVVGFLGEIIVADYIGAEISNTYDYDLVKGGNTFDVKTKECTSKPRKNFNCSVAAYNTKQKCGFYVFVRILSDLSKGWILGGYGKESFYKDAFFGKKGEIEAGSNPPFTFKADCYNLKIGNLKTLKQG